MTSYQYLIIGSGITAVTTVDGIRTSALHLLGLAISETNVGRVRAHGGYRRNGFGSVDGSAPPKPKR